MKTNSLKLLMAAFCLLQTLFAQSGWTDMKPKMYLGWHGQVRAVAVNPSLPNEAYAGSWGGVFKSTDGGVRWNILPNFPGTLVEDIAVSPTNPSIIIASGTYLGRIDKRFGVFRSTDKGNTWQAVSGSFFPLTTECPDRVSGHEISFVPNTSTVYVGTDCGLLKSTDNGATWAEEDHTRFPRLLSDPSNFATTGNRKAIAVLAIDADHVIVGGPKQTFFKSPSSGWQISYQPFPYKGCDKINGLDFVKQAPNIVFRSDFQLAGLYYSTNYGETWDRFPNQPAFEGNIGPMVRIVQNAADPARFDLYYGTGVNMYLTTLKTDQSDWTSARFELIAETGSDLVSTIRFDHVDIQDLAFHPTAHVPLLLASDGGVARWLPLEKRFKMAENAVQGLSALEIYGMDVVDYGRPNEEVFITTWHNSGAVGTNDGQNWQDWGLVEARGLQGPHGFNQNPADTRIALSFFNRFFDGSRRRDFICNFPAIYTMTIGLPYWGNVNNNVGLVAIGQESQMNSNFAVFRNSSPECTNWVKIADFSSTGFIFQLHLSKQAGTNALSLVLPLLDGSVQFKLARIRNFENLNSSIRPEFPAMNGLSSFGTSLYLASEFIWDVNPENDLEMIAYDFRAMTFLQSSDGGDNWVSMPALNSLTTNNGDYYANLPGARSQATIVSYDYYQPNRIFVGTRELGIFVSYDSGNSWQHLPDGPAGPIKSIATIRTNSNGDIFVSSIGMGLWQWKEPRRLAGGFRSPYAIRELIIDPQTGVHAPIGTIGDPENCPACAWVLAKQGLIKNYAFEEKTNTLKVWATQPGQVYTFAAKGLSLKVDVLQADLTTKFANCAACNTKTGTQEVRMLAWEAKSVKGVAIAEKANWHFGDAQIYAKGLQNSPSLPGAIGKSVPENAKIPISTLPEKSANISLGDGNAALGFFKIENGKPILLKGNGFHYSGNPAQDSAMVFLDGSFLKMIPISRKSTIAEEIKPNFAPGLHHIAVVAKQNQEYYKAETSFELKNTDEENIKIK